jgi:hypothetical protein
MSNWTHAICDDCWDERYPDRNKSPRRGMGDLEMCCWCGKDTNSGIYIREDPNVVNFA